MCTVCGCATPAHADDQRHEHEHEHEHGHGHGHGHGHHHSHDHGHLYAHEHAHEHHDHEHGHSHARHEHLHHHPRDDGPVHRHEHGGATLDYGAALAGIHVPGLTSGRIVRIERDILGKNNAYAAQNRARLARNGIFALNFVSSPGSGKTALLVRAIEDLKARLPIRVIEGDQQTANDAARIRATGVPAVQINTGKGCHLDASMVGRALGDPNLELDLHAGGLLFIENVGNLVCPAAFDLGEAHKVVLLSVTEGEDKPLKYPDMFAAADLMLLNKADLLPHVDFDVDACVANALRVNPRLRCLVVSARSGEGMADFYAWIEACAALTAATAANTRRAPAASQANAT
ncbi:hydrogenase nickel incorporation protein HypB [Burkholderia multivorans]|uniref:hydrogenase nickel incorporation protein HypB n=1 Tax=Burkholderia multivorans TaxID=87883 RepID=UPI000D00B203|nr:hydrogenase nickel incorporation protein HypB [Burkholderia multivorans]PRH18941.1 hydrogenase accessory protein HypB [Burkholderia multivorans]